MLLYNALRASPKIHWGQALRGPIYVLYAANQAESKPLLAVACCKIMKIQHVAGKKKTGRRACPTKGLEKTRNLSLSFEGLPLLKGSGPIIQNQKVRLPAPGKNGTFKRWAALFQGTVQSTSSLGNLQDDVSWLNPWT